MQINLYPITLFRGTATIATGSREKIPAIDAYSVFVTRGVWDLCSEAYYYGVCTRVSSTMQDVHIAFTVRSIHLVGDTGPSFIEPPVARAGPDVPLEHENRIIETAPAPSPVVAPKVEEGGRAGANPALAGTPAPTGRETKFFAAPATGGLRVLACSQQPGPNPGARCVQSAADGFCVSQSFTASAYREFEVVGGQSFLTNVLCTKGGDAAAEPKGGGLRIPFLKK